MVAGGDTGGDSATVRPSAAAAKAASLSSLAAPLLQRLQTRVGHAVPCRSCAQMQGMRSVHLTLAQD